jgi:glucose-6-phosphate 1-dehydrogenase
MDFESHQCNIVFVLFGATGDLAHRKILPALFNLFIDKQLARSFSIVGIGRSDFSDTDLRGSYQGSVKRYSERSFDAEKWQDFAKNITFLQGDYGDGQTYSAIADVASNHRQNWEGSAETVFYLSTPPTVFAQIARELGKAGLAEPHNRSRIVVEKPIGDSLRSFHEINGIMREYFEESQIFRIDHFLGKETVQNILAMRFANPIFEPIWNRHYIDHVTITVAESDGIGKRGGYYEHAGALRDMVQNHLIQLLCLATMEPPIAYDADDIRSKKMDVLHALQSIPRHAVSEFAARGQYGEGCVAGEQTNAYRQEKDVAPDSNVETFAALKAYIDNWRWQGVPFYMRTGKRLTHTVSEISIRFRNVPHCAFPSCDGLNAQPARLVIQIQPKEGMFIKFMAKEPGYAMRLQPVAMRFTYQEAFGKRVPDAYETLLRDAMLGDATLFMRTDQVDAAWRFITPVLDSWQQTRPAEFPNYAAGLWGPESAEALIAQDGRSWMSPTMT